MNLSPGNVLWTENLETIGTKTHEGLFAAWKRLFGERLEMMNSVQDHIPSRYEWHGHMPNGKMFTLIDHTYPDAPKMPSQIYESVPTPEKEAPSMTTTAPEKRTGKRIAIDVETIEDPNLSLAAKEYIQNIGKNKKQDGFSGALVPIACNIVSIAMVNVETGRGGVYYLTPGEKRSKKTEQATLVGCPTEADLMNRFWGNMACQRIVTWRGRTFDVPVIAVRSAVHASEIKHTYGDISNWDPSDDISHWGGNRYRTDWHADMADLISGFGAKDSLSLDLTCEILGIPSPKINGIDGSKVAELWAAKKHDEIAEYNLRDADAAAKIYMRLRALSDAHIGY